MKSEYEEKGNVVGIFCELANLPSDSMVSESALAGMLGVTTRTIRNMVTRHELPRGVRFGGRKIWFAGKVIEWLRNKADENIIEANKLQGQIKSYGLS